MKSKSLLWGFIIALALSAVLIGTVLPTLAAPQAQMTPFPTPTPGPDGRIVYIVKNGDSLWRISAVANIPLDELRVLNNLGSDEVITPGQQLLLGLGGPSGIVPTYGPPPTPTSSLPTPTPGIGFGMICVLLYNDINGDSIRQEEEPSLLGGVININDRAGSVSFTIDTPSGGLSDVLFPDPEELGFTCFEELEEGEYNITAAIPDGYNATTRLTYSVQLLPRDENFYDFGAQANTETLNAAPAPVGTGRSPSLGIIGGLLLAGGVGLGIYSGFFRRK
jgi:LysM repeat protein